MFDKFLSTARTIDKIYALALFALILAGIYIWIPTLTGMVVSLHTDILSFFLGGSFAVVLVNFVELINQ